MAIRLVFTPATLDALALVPDPMRCAQLILDDDANRPLVLTKADVENYAACIEKEQPAQKAPGKQPLEKPLSTVTTEDVVVLKDITGNSTCVGNVIDFAKLFNDRYSSLRKILSRRRELSGLLPIAKVKKVQRDIKFVGIVNDIKTTKNGHTLLDLEDEEDKIQVLIMKGSRKSSESFVKDEVVGIAGSLSRDGEIVVATVYAL